MTSQTEAQSKPREKRSSRFWGVRLIGFGVLFWLLWKVDLTSVGQALLDIDHVPLSIAVLLNVVLISLRSRRWMFFLAANNIQYPFLPAVSATLSGTLLGLITPGRVGELTRAYFVHKDKGVPLLQVVTSVLIDRLYDFWAIVLIGMWAISVTGQSENVEAGQWMVLTAVLGVMGCVAFYLMLTTQLFDRVLEQLKKTQSNIGKKILNMRNDLRAGFDGMGKRALSIGGVFTAIAYTVFLIQCNLLAQSVGLDVTFVEISAVVATGSIVGMLPISFAGIGTRDAAIVAFMGVLGVGFEDALVFSLLTFFCFHVVVGSAGAIAWWLRKDKPGKHTSEHKIG